MSNTENAATTTKTLYQAIRALHPRARRPLPVGIIHNGSSRRVVECIHCGATESCCGKYPETKRVRQFRATHNAECGAELIRQAEAQA